MLILLISYTSTVLYYTGIFLGNEDWGCEKVMGVWNIEDRRAEVKRRRRESRGAVCMGAEGGGGGEGCACPLPRKFFDFRSPHSDLVHSGGFFYNSAASFTRKNWCFCASKICRCDSLLLLYFKLMIMTDGLRSHHNPVSLTDSSLYSLPHVNSACQWLIRQSFIIILCIERRIYAIVLVVNYCTNTPNLNQITLLNDKVSRQTVAVLFFQPQCIISIVNSNENVMNPKLSYTEWKWAHYI